MEKNGVFADFDHQTVYDQSQLRALDELTRNFVIEFGKEKAHIAFDLGVADVESLLKTERQDSTPVRWM